MILSVFGDESSDEAQQRVFALSGIVGTDEAWKLAKDAWVARTNRADFHANECHDHILYKDLTQILVNGYLGGFNVAIDLVAFRDMFGATLQDTGYYKCLSDLLAIFSEAAEQFNKKTPSPEYLTDEQVSLEFTFDHRKQSMGNAGTLYSAFINQPELAERAKTLLGSKISFDCRTNPRIQMADLMAYEAMKEMDRQITNSRPRPRGSYTALSETEKFRFIYRDRKYCEWWKSQQPQLEKKQNLSQQDFVNWLVKTGQIQHGKPHDNWGTRLAYLIWKDRQRKP